MLKFLHKNCILHVAFTHMLRCDYNHIVCIQNILPSIAKSYAHYYITVSVIGICLCDREYREHVKDLTCVSKDLSRTVIVDNNPFSFLLQPSNGVPCVPFFAAQPCDNQVTDLL